VAVGHGSVQQGRYIYQSLARIVTATEARASVNINLSSEGAAHSKTKHRFWQLGATGFSTTLWDYTRRTIPYQRHRHAIARRKKVLSFSSLLHLSHMNGKPNPHFVGQQGGVLWDGRGSFIPCPSSVE
jgi:hypothetical protein